jgi:heptosyltransferase-3
MAPALPQRPVVIYRLGSLGDTIVALPCFHAITLAHPMAERVVLTNFPVSHKAAPLEGILGGSGLMSRAMAYPVGTRSWKELWAVRKQLKALGSDTLYYLTPARGRLAAWRDWAFFKLCGFRRIVGAPLTADLQTNRVRNAQGHLEHEAERLARCLRHLGTIPLHDPAWWDLGLQAQEQGRADACLQPIQQRPFVAINMGGKVAINDWGMDHWRSLLSSLSAAYPDLGLLVVGGPEDSQRAQAAAQLWSGTVVNACGALTPRESAAALGRASLFIGHDSGPMHLAAAMGVRCIGLFGPNNPPGKWHPYGVGHLPLHDMRGVRHIGVSAVLDAAHILLEHAQVSA